jgi:hypothetical protein
MKRSLACFFLLALLSATASASPLVVSTFDSNREGWNASFGAAVGAGAIWQSSGGNPAGNLVAPDSSSGTTTWYFGASADTPPSPLLGNHANAYGGTLEYDLRIENFAGNYYDTSSDFDVWISGNGLTLLYDGGFHPGSSWSHFSIPLVASAGWQKNLFFPATTPATEAEVQSALSNITSIQIRGNYTDAATTTHLDNVGFYAVPEPTGITLAGLALFGFMGLRRGRGRAA